VGVVHEVIDGVGPAGAAGVPAGGAPKGGAGLGGGVADLVAAALAAGRGVAARAAALEGVVEAEVVADLVGGGVALVVGERAPTRHRGVEDDDAVHVVVLGVHPRERGPAEEAAGGVARVDVEVGGRAVAQR